MVRVGAWPNVRGSPTSGFDALDIQIGRATKAAGPPGPYVPGPAEPKERIGDLLLRQWRPDNLHVIGMWAYWVIVLRGIRTPALVWPGNVWMGVTVEDNEHLSRVERLREVPSAVRFLSIEPLLGQLPALNLDGIDWVIIGGESGPGARPMHEDWVLEIRDACLDRAVPFFFKQWGGTRKKAAGRELESRKWSEMPCRPVGVA
jgi:hypothetical protein